MIKVPKLAVNQRRRILPEKNKGFLNIAFELLFNTNYIIRHSVTLSIDLLFPLCPKIDQGKIQSQQCQAILLLYSYKSGEYFYPYQPAIYNTTNRLQKCLHHTQWWWSGGGGVVLFRPSKIGTLPCVKIFFPFLLVLQQHRQLFEHTLQELARLFPIYVIKSQVMIKV